MNFNRNISFSAVIGFVGSSTIWMKKSINESPLRGVQGLGKLTALGTFSTVFTALTYENLCIQHIQDCIASIDEFSLNSFQNDFPQRLKTQLHALVPLTEERMRLNSTLHDKAYALEKKMANNAK